jgi:anti-sigma regulatory factor (Ser/Thr protein kinase)
MPAGEIRAEIGNGPNAAAEARHVVDRLEGLPDRFMDDVRLVVSELVTNSYKHAGNPVGHPIEVILDLTEDRLRLEVIDRSIFDPTPETDEELRSAKWGLTLVDRVSDRWGRHSEGGVWAEFRLEDLS